MGLGLGVRVGGACSDPHSPIMQEYELISITRAVDSSQLMVPEYSSQPGTSPSQDFLRANIMRVGSVVYITR